MLLEDLNWMDVERYLERDDRVVLITGACEQHGYLSLLADIRIPLEVAKRACETEGVLIAPPVPYGISPHFAAYPGTLSLRPETFARVVRELIEGLLLQGFRRVLISNGHGGNTGTLIPLLIELGNAHSDARFAFFEWWRSPKVVAVAEEARLPQRHANWSENFSFTHVAPVPEGEKEGVEIPSVASADARRALLGDGSFGGPYQVDEGIMARFLEVAVETMIDALQRL